MVTVITHGALVASGSPPIVQNSPLPVEVALPSVWSLGRVSVPVEVAMLRRSLELVEVARFW